MRRFQEATVVEELAELLRREADALSRLESRLRALELVVAADEQRFVSLALEELEDASEQLAGLELARVLALSAAGYGPDVTAETLLTSDRNHERRLADAVEQLRDAMRGAVDARERAVAVVSHGGGGTRTRLACATAR